MFFGEHRIDSVRQMILSAPDVKNLKAKIAGIEKELAKATNNKTLAIKRNSRRLRKNLQSLCVCTFLLSRNYSPYSVVILSRYLRPWMDSRLRYDFSTRLSMNSCLRKNTIKKKWQNK